MKFHVKLICLTIFLSLIVCCMPVAADTVVDTDLVWSSNVTSPSFTSTEVRAVSGVHSYTSGTQSWSDYRNFQVVSSGIINASRQYEVVSGSSYNAYLMHRDSFDQGYEMAYFYTLDEPVASGTVAVTVSYDYYEVFDNWEDYMGHYEFVVAAALPGPEIIQHVTVTDPGFPSLYYSGELQRDSYTSHAVLTSYRFGVSTVILDDTSSSDITWGGLIHDDFGNPIRYVLDVTINGETKSVSWGGSVTPTPTPTPTPTKIPDNITNVTPLDPDEPWSWPDPPIPDLGDLRLPDHIPGLDWLEDLKNDAKNSSSSSFPLYSDLYLSWTNTIDNYQNIIVTAVSSFIRTLFAPIYTLQIVLIGFLTKVTAMLAGLAPFIYVPGMFLGALFRLLPPFLVNIAALFILLDAIFMFIRWAIPELNRQVNN